MLVDPEFGGADPVIVALVSSMGRGGATPERLSRGVYLAGHWNVGDLVRGGVRDRWDEDDAEYLDFETYGVCDSPEQVVERLNLEARPEPFFVSLVKIRKGDEPRDGGWRWHKWGAYIGDQNPQCEYIAHEPEIEEVYTFHVYELHAVPEPAP